MFRINYIIRRSKPLAEIRKNAPKQGCIRAHDSKLNIGTLIQEFTNHGHAARRMSKAPV